MSLAPKNPLLRITVAVFALCWATAAFGESLEEIKVKAEAGDANSESQFGLRYAKGQGVAKNEVEAVKWYRQAAEQGNAAAQDNLGVCYANGQGVAKYEVEGVEGVRKSAEQE